MTCQKSTAFPTDVTRLSPPPFLRREPGDKAGKLLGQSSPNVRGRKLARDTSLSLWEEQQYHHLGSLNSLVAALTLPFKP